MIIALNYDSAFLSNPDLWSHFIRMARSFGHECLLFTTQLETAELCDSAGAVADYYNCHTTLVFTDSQKVKGFDSKGIVVDLWIEKKTSKGLCALDAISE